MTPRIIIVFVLAPIVGLVLSVIFAYTGRCYFTHWWAVLIVNLWGTGPALLLGIIAYVIAKKFKSNKVMWVAAILFAFVIIASLQLLSIQWGSPLYDHDVEEAQEFCETVISQIEQHKAETGEYPETIDDYLPPQEEQPRLLQGKYQDVLYYRDFDPQNPGHFEIYFDDPAAMLGGAYRYASNQPNWHYYDDWG